MRSEMINEKIVGMDSYLFFLGNDKFDSEIHKCRLLRILSRSSGVCVDFHFDGEVY